MAFIQKNFAPTGGQSTRGLVPAGWSYKTDDTHATIDTAGYFNDMSSLLAIGDVITAVVVTNLGASNEAVATYGTHIVLSNAAGIVDISNVTVNVVTDTD